MRRKEMKKRRVIDGGKKMYIPEEIIRNILKRLRVKSLIRFQCVSKAWNNLIKTQSFITDHLHHSTSQNPYLIFDSCLFQCMHVLDSTLKLRELQKSPLFNSFNSRSIAGSCNGLLLLEKLGHQGLYVPLLLCNPATKEVTRVPLSTTVAEDWLLHDYFCSTGFGFNPIVNDYVIVRIYDKCVKSVAFGEVFSLRRGSWKKLDVGVLKGVRIFYVFGSGTADGVILWTGEKIEGDNYGDVIVSFDIVNEVFTLIPCPNLRGCCLYCQSTTYENKVVLLCIRVVEGLCELWVLDEGSCASGRNWRWTKRCMIGHFLGTFSAWTVWRNNLVGIDYHEKVLYLRDLLTNEVQRFGITCPSRITGCYRYVESLVLFGNYFNGEASS